MNNPIEFRRQTRGYNREDVNEFISQENIRFNKLEESYLKTIKEYERENSELKQQLSEIDLHKDKIVEHELKIAGLEASLESSTQAIAEKDAIIEGLKTACDSSNEKLTIANSLIDDLRKQISAQPVAAEPKVIVREPSYSYDSSVLEKAEKYDSICDKVDEIFAFAKEEADKIIAEAFEIRKQASKRNAVNMKSEISERSESIIDELRRSIRRQFKSK